MTCFADVDLGQVWSEIKMMTNLNWNQFDQIITNLNWNQIIIISILVQFKLQFYAFHMNEEAYFPVFRKKYGIGFDITMYDSVIVQICQSLETSFTNGCNLLFIHPVTDNGYDINLEFVTKSRLSRPFTANQSINVQSFKSTLGVLDTNHF